MTVVAPQHVGGLTWRDARDEGFSGDHAVRMCVCGLSVYLSCRSVCVCVYVCVGVREGWLPFQSFTLGGEDQEAEAG